MTPEVCVRIDLPVVFRDGMQLEVMVPLQASFSKVFEKLSDHGRRDGFDLFSGARQLAMKDLMANLEFPIHFRFKFEVRLQIIRTGSFLHKTFTEDDTIGSVRNALAADYREVANNVVMLVNGRRVE
jgi:hypothetical protein